MTQMTVRVTFTVQGTPYEMRASTLFDPTAARPAPPARRPVAGAGTS